MTKLLSPRVPLPNVLERLPFIVSRSIASFGRIFRDDRLNALPSSRVSLAAAISAGALGGHHSDECSERESYLNGQASLSTHIARARARLPPARLQFSAASDCLDLSPIPFQPSRQGPSQLRSLRLIDDGLDTYKKTSLLFGDGARDRARSRSRDSSLL